jgi:hypothetical protein
MMAMGAKVPSNIAGIFWSRHPKSIAGSFSRPPDSNFAFSFASFAFTFASFAFAFASFSFAFSSFAFAFASFSFAFPLPSPSPLHSPSLLLTRGGYKDMVLNCDIRQRHAFHLTLIFPDRLQ